MSEPCAIKVVFKYCLAVFVITIVMTLIFAIPYSLTGCFIAGWAFFDQLISADGGMLGEWSNHDRDEKNLEPR
jgi:hypothetical protein